MRVRLRRFLLLWALVSILLVSMDSLANAAAFDPTGLFLGTLTVTKVVTSAAPNGRAVQAAPSPSVVAITKNPNRVGQWMLVFVFPQTRMPPQYGCKEIVKNGEDNLYCEQLKGGVDTYSGVLKAGVWVGKWASLGGSGGSMGTFKLVKQ